jgi:hypothetical protein
MPVLSSKVVLGGVVIVKNRTSNFSVLCLPSPRQTPRANPVRGPPPRASVLRHGRYYSLQNHDDMISDFVRVNAYASALHKFCSGRKVLDVGSGPFTLLARISLLAKAASVDAVEHNLWAVRHASSLFAHPLRSQQLRGSHSLLRRHKIAFIPSTCVHSLVLSPPQHQSRRPSQPPRSRSSHRGNQKTTLPFAVVTLASGVPSEALQEDSWRREASRLPASPSSWHRQQQQRQPASSVDSANWRERRPNILSSEPQTDCKQTSGAQRVSRQSAMIALSGSCLFWSRPAIAYLSWIFLQHKLAWRYLLLLCGFSATPTCCCLSLRCRL